MYRWGTLLHFFIQKKSAVEEHRFFYETYGDHALSETACSDWLRLFKTNDFDVEGKKTLGSTENVWRRRIGGIISWIFIQAQAELAELLGVVQTPVSKSFKEFGIIRKQGHWGLCVLKLRDVERILSHVNSCFCDRKGNVLLHCIMTSDQRWIDYDNPMRRS